jgi:serine/threonine protein kinase
VFLVEDATREFKGNWVLKRLKNVDSAARRTRFDRETKVIQGVSHPNVLKVIDSDLTAARPYFVSEFCERGSLLDVGPSNFRGNMKATVETILPIMDGLVAVHAAGLIHRDIKPANILIRGNGTPVIGDFGICFVEDGKQITISDEGIGSKNFIAPEMESGQRDLGDPTDVRMSIAWKRLSTGCFRVDVSFRGKIIARIHWPVSSMIRDSSMYTSFSIRWLSESLKNAFPVVSSEGGLK